MDMINLKINGIAVSVPKGSTVLEAARAAGVEVPTLCYMKEKNEIGACRICVVEVNEGRGFRIVTACVYPAAEGMEVLTNSEKVQKARKTTLELILSTHNMESVEELCDNIALINKSKLVITGGVDDIRREHGNNNVEIVFTDGDGRHTEIAQNAPGLLQSYIEKGVQINSYKELMPRMNDIFIKLVTEAK